MKLTLQSQALLTSSAFAFLAQKLEVYTEHLNKVAYSDEYKAPECSLVLPSDDMIFLEADRLLKKMLSPKLKYVIDIGIGGSNLGTKAIYDALIGFKDNLEPDLYPKMLFADTNDAAYLQALSRFLQEQVKDPEEILIVLISKSGSTTETIVNFEIIYHALQKKFPSLHERVVVISDENSPLWKVSGRNKFQRQSLPQLVGGRYSVFSAVGIVPLLACGIDVQKLLVGAKAMREQCLLHNLSLNPALLSACVLYHYSFEGKSIHDTFLFHPQLESVGKWYRQLIGESIGKEHDRDGNRVNIGITPTVSIGSTDLHSMGQLYLGGPKDKVATFVHAKKEIAIAKVPEQMVLAGLVPNIENSKTGRIMDAILQGVRIAYEKADVPYMHIELPILDEESLGQFLQMKMIEIMYLAELFNINAFDQPNVESYKVETKQILAR